MFYAPLYEILICTSILRFPKKPSYCNDILISFFLLIKKPNRIEYLHIHSIGSPPITLMNFLTYSALPIFKS